MANAGTAAKHLSFYNIKDSFGITQLVVPGASQSHLREIMRGIPTESSVLIEGEVKHRPSSARRESQSGEIEVEVRNVVLLNPVCEQLPFLPSEEENLPNEDIRLKYRYLDLRRDALTRNMKKRHQITHLTRNYLNDSGRISVPLNGFLEVETPMLIRSSPEGAREFLVPSRIYDPDPHFYALPQSPQQLKQILICSGSVDKYYQIARCFRDEDGRKDRQPEFTQIDMEMAYISWGSRDSSPEDGWRIGGLEIRHVVENLMKQIWKVAMDMDLLNFPVLTYREAIAKYGSDKPDLRIPLQIHSLTGSRPNQSEHIVEFLIIRRDDSGFSEVARSLAISPTDNDIERFVISDDNIRSWYINSEILNVQGPDTFTHLAEFNLVVGDIIWVSTRETRRRSAYSPLGQVRLKLASLAESLGHYVPSSKPHFLWITEFPLFTRDDDDKNLTGRGRWCSTHHPFTAPMADDLELFWNNRIEEVRGQHYDLVLNGVEIGGGSVRIHDRLMQEHTFTKILELSEHERASFDHLLSALSCGAPPHGGIAIEVHENEGLDRLLALLCNAKSIRDVIAFPKNASGMDLLLKSPSPIGGEVLKTYGLKSIRKTI
ncbi:hypothetical protein Clacol_001554 [Clathrus columnatus]|uniref:Aminoacyl-transfer RNA synthetases class-II family profile domain-containing protein n=1 Tax=Clathrus columnatus TaxID=1419009 RepID=A0AAV5A1K2_9AGAM|nr:hypothetical protein Clacol_001554 [Clathrus columnatus]